MKRRGFLQQFQEVLATRRKNNSRPHARRSGDDTEDTSGSGDDSSNDDSGDDRGQYGESVIFYIYCLSLVVMIMKYSTLYNVLSRTMIVVNVATVDLVVTHLMKSCETLVLVNNSGLSRCQN